MSHYLLTSQGGLKSIFDLAWVKVAGELIGSLRPNRPHDFQTLNELFEFFLGIGFKFERLNQFLEFPIAFNAIKALCSQNSSAAKSKTISKIPVAPIK
jgi:hypothetical protein